MPTSALRRTRAHRASTPDRQIMASSPSGPRSKRRKVNREPNMSSVQEVVEASETNLDQMNAVIASLAMPDPNVMVAIKYANDENFRQSAQGISAYAKVAGASWTYYVKELSIRIGRPPDTRPSTAGSPTPPPQQKPEDFVHIDLGPSKLVSRSHATISYDINGEHNWQLHVLGRNGLKVDEEPYKKDTTVVLHSGSVIEIGGLQMMFVLPDRRGIIHPSFLRHARIPAPLEDDNRLQITQSNESSSYDTATMPSSQSARPSSSSSRQLMPPVNIIESSSQQEGHNRKADEPAFPRGVVVLTAENVDYSDDALKDMKPPYSYAMMIAQAILSSEGEQLTLAAIYSFITEKYSFYRHSKTGWQNSIRHNLSLSKAFRKIPRRTDEPGKGMKWELLAEHRDEYIKKLQKATKTGSGRPGSAPSSPSSPKPSKGTQSQASYAINHQLPQSLRIDDSEDPNMGYTAIKHSPRSVTPPPIASYNRVAPLEAYTPDRGSRLPALRNQDKTLLDVSTNHHPRRSSIITAAHTNDMISSSQNHLTSSIHGDSGNIPSPSQPSPYGDEHPAMTAVTPAPQRQHPRLAPPSTGQLPSSYLPTSSPAPFWKYVQFGSTPAKHGDYSPSKDLHSSSPPPAAGAETSSRIRELGSPLKERGGGFHLAGTRGEPSLIPDIKEDDDEDELGDFQGVDLARGFEKIGKFHMNGRISGGGWGA